MAELCETECPVSCPGPFERLIVYPSIRAGARVEWTFAASFADPHPWVFRLEVGRTGLSGADDWTQVGLPATEAGWLEDDQDRVFGSYQWTHYRVRLQTPRASYVSEATSCLGRMARQDWARAQDMFRRARLGIDKRLTSDSGLQGWLLKRRLYGTPCTICLDHLTREVKDPRCRTCWGTGFVGGYFQPKPCAWVGIKPAQIRSELLDGAHMTFECLSQGQMIADPILHPRDVWVSGENDFRWGVIQIVPAIEIRGVPIVYRVALGRFPFQDIVYEVPIPGHPGPPA